MGSITQVGDREQYEIECDNCPDNPHLISIAGGGKELGEFLSMADHGEDEIVFCPTCSAAVERVLPLFHGRNLAKPLTLKPAHATEPRRPQTPDPPEDPGPPDTVPAGPDGGS